MQFWLTCRKGIIELDRVHKRFTTMLPGLAVLNYQKRLDRLGLFSWSIAGQALQN